MGSNVPKSGADSKPNKNADAKKEEKFGLLDHAKRELKLAGLDQKDADYEGELAKWTLELLEVFVKQGHSGNSGSNVVDIIKQLVHWGPLSPFTDDAAEWKEETDNLLNDEQRSAGEKIWMNQRVPSVFSMDHGKTWFRMDGKRREDGSLEVFKTVTKEGNSEKSTGETAEKAGSNSTNKSAESKASKTNNKDAGRVQEKKDSSGNDGNSKDGDKPRTSPSKSKS